MQILGSTNPYTRKGSAYLPVKILTGRKAADSAAANKEATVRHGFRINVWFLLISMLFVTLGLLLFQAKLLLMGDDADYILDAWNFVHKGIYPAGRSSLYGMILGIPIALFGINIILLKSFSFLCAVTGLFFLYRSFNKRIPYRLLYPVLLFSAINSSLQYYSSSNLSEAFFMMIQYGFIGATFLLLKKLENYQENTRKYWLLLGAAGLLISLSKNIALIAPVSVAVYFLLKKEWKNGLRAIASFLSFKIPYDILLRVLFKQNAVTSQWGQIMAKDLYHHEKGMETFAGFINRFVSNIQIYFSGVALKEYGLDTGKNSLLFITFLFTALLLFGTVHSYKRNKYVFFTGIYLMLMCTGIFFALQPAAYQDRIIIILVPLLFLLGIYAVDVLLCKLRRQIPLAQTVGLGFLFLLLFYSNLNRTFNLVKETWPILRENIGGDPLYGYTPDWLNYLAMGQWITEHLPDSAVVAARKPNSLTVYSNGRPFFGVYTFPTNLDATQLLKQLKDNHVRYIVLASLRANPSRYIPNNYVSTLHNYIRKIGQRYKGAFRIIHQEGTQEACYLVEVHYPPGLP